MYNVYIMSYVPYLRHCTLLTWLVSVAFCAAAPLMAAMAKMKVRETSGIILRCLLLTSEFRQHQRKSV